MNFFAFLYAPSKFLIFIIIKTLNKKKFSVQKIPFFSEIFFQNIKKHVKTSKNIQEKHQKIFQFGGWGRPLQKRVKTHNEIEFSNLQAFFFIFFLSFPYYKRKNVFTHCVSVSVCFMCLVCWVCVSALCVYVLCLGKSSPSKRLRETQNLLKTT